MCVFWILSTDFIVLNVFYRRTFYFKLGYSNWFHMETPALHIRISREKARGTVTNKHDISVCIDDILCTCLTKRLCSSPKSFLLWFSQSNTYEFHTTLSRYDWMKPEISGFVFANSIPDIATAPVFVFSG